MSTSPSTPEPTRDAITRDDLPALRAILDERPLAKQLGMTLSEFHHGRAVAEMPAGDLLPNFLGFAHTGALFALAEHAMSAAANSLGHVGLPLSCDMQFLKGGDPTLPTRAVAHVVDTQGRIARVQVELFQEDTPLIRISEMVFLRSGTRG